MITSDIKKVVLAYSGGLDTSVIIPWLKENYNSDVIAVCVDIGQGEGLNQIYDKAIKSGASKVVVDNLTKEFVEKYIFQALKANAVYEEKYLLGTSLARPIIAKKLVEVAISENAEAIAHGATGKGNDQVRFELSIKALAPELKIIAPWREWKIDSREAEIEYAKAHNIQIPAINKIYSMDRNIWHLSHEGSDLEEPWNAPKNNLLLISEPPENAQEKPEEISIDFEKGIPIAINEKKFGSVEIVKKLNEIGARNGVGIVDICENRIVGMKSRGVYENPAASILYYAHRELEYLCLDRATFHFKQHVAIKYGELVYDGMWFSPLREALAAFVDATQKTVSGTVKLKLYKGNVISAGIKSPYSLYNKEFVTFEHDDVYDQSDATGFINLFGLPLKIQALVNNNK